MALIQLHAVTKGFGVGRHRTDVLGGIDLTVTAGEFLAIVGYSGSGKTTLLSLLAGLLQADTGDIWLEGQPMDGPGPDRAVVFQNYSLLPWLTVRENIGLAVDAVHKGESAAYRQRCIQQHMDLVRLTHAADRRPHELSGGMRQRVSLARALATHPRILLLDEPLGALDALTRATLQDEIARLWAEDKKTVVLITNDVDEGLYLADRIIPLSPGPGAKLGPEIHIPFPRPRDRRALNHDPEFQDIRRRVLGYLLDSGRDRARAGTPACPLPDIQPDIRLPRRLFPARL